MEEKFQVVEESPGRHIYPIRPNDIDIALSSTFGKAEVEEAARNIILFCQQRGGWYPFSLEELSNFYMREERDCNMMFFGLSGIWYDDAMLSGGFRESHPCLVICGDGMYRVTDQFIERCAKTFKE